MPVRSARPTPTRSGSTAASATAARWPGAAVPRTTSGAATLEPASAVTESAAALGTTGGPSRSEMVESPQRIADAVVTGAIRTFRPSTLVPFALPRSTIVTSESETSRRACSRESAASGITISVPLRPIRSWPRRSATSVPAPGPLSTASSKVAVSGWPGPGRDAAPDVLNDPCTVGQRTVNQYGTLDQGRHANRQSGDRGSPDEQPAGPVAPGDGGLQVRARAGLRDLDGQLNELPVRRRTCHEGARCESAVEDHPGHPFLRGGPGSTLGMPRPGCAPEIRPCG